MPATKVSAAALCFDFRLAALSHLLRVGFESTREPDASLLAHRLALDMFPLRAQVAFACNQP